MRKIRLAIAGLTACSGCQLSLLNCEDELPELVERFEFSFFPLACSPAELTGEYDAAMVEGCLSMPHEKELLLELRARSRYLIALGTCAVWGGIATLRNGENREQLRQLVYGQNPVADATFDPKSLKDLVQVDAGIVGCPPETAELLRLLAGLLRGALPEAIDYPVCTECNMREKLCLLLGQNKICLGLLTSGGCGAKCPSLSVPCEGCRGPALETNLEESFDVYARHGFDRLAVRGRLRRFCPEWLL
ncbi:MAG: NADH:ubiquinone oxidoreductase [Desulfuromonadaceae bacterium]|nr:NADH:ubiquinone oxidoreductase [Desulfuromonadaceae bacterium]MDD5105474.1 NADH:ubiquinone oxidoreductase [Desulfuromonadaceae bacterium]